MTLPVTSPLIDAHTLRDRLTRPGVIVVDVSFDLADPQAGQRLFAAAHIPGAQFLDLETELSGPKQVQGVFQGRHPLPDREVFRQRIGLAGISPDTEVIAYDRHGSMFAARLWWLLSWLGHDKVRVLDGGWQAWQAAGGAVETQAHGVAPASVYPERAALVHTLSAAELLSRLDTGVALVDARAPERYRGETEPLDARAGHIPGALNHFFKRNLQEDGRFLPPQALKDHFGRLWGDDTASAAVVHQCGSGVTACHNLLATAVAGLEPGLLYPGSWSEWSSDPQRPVAQG